MKSQTIVIYLPKRNQPGGAQILFARLAKYFIEEGFSVKLVDFPDGYIRNYLENESEYTFVSIRNNQKVKLTDNEMLFTSLVNVGEVFINFNWVHNTKLILWDLGPYSLIQRHLILGNSYKKMSLKKASQWSSIFEKKRKTKIKQFILKGTEKNGIYFMCGKNFHYNQKFFDLNLKPNYLPIPLYVPKQIKKLRITKSKRYIQVAWLGRLVPAKAESLFRLKKDFENLIQRIPKYKIKLHVVGNGEKGNEIEKEFKNCSFDVNFTGRMEGESLDEFISTSVDLAFAMGTSALEFSKMGIPTVLTEGMNKLHNGKESTKRYNWLHKSTDFNLSSEPLFNRIEDQCSLKEILRDFLENGSEIGVECFRYTKNVHSFEIIMNEIQEIIDRNEFTIADASQYFNESPNGIDRVLYSYLKTRSMAATLKNQYK